MRSEIRKLFVGTLVVMCTAVMAQDELEVPYSYDVVIDGVMHPGEWESSGHVDIDLGSGKYTRVFFAHDLNTMFFAFAGHLESENALFPEVLIDALNNKSSSWDDDDWWFHVSATDCDAVGMPSTFNHCLLDHDDWDAEPNILNDAVITDTVEIGISLEKLGVLAPINGFGIAFRTTNIITSTYYWPETAYLGDPSTWATFKLLSTTSVADQSPEAFTIYPTHTKGTVCFDDLQKFEFKKIEVVDYLGRVHMHIDNMPKNSCIDVSDYQSGVYYVCMTTERGIITQTFIKS